MFLALLAMFIRLITLPLSLLLYSRTTVMFKCVNFFAPVYHHDMMVLRRDELAESPVMYCFTCVAYSLDVHHRVFSKKQQLTANCWS